MMLSQNFKNFLPAVCKLSGATIYAIMLIALVIQPKSSAAPESQIPSKLQGKTVVLPAGTTFEGNIDNKIGSSVSHAQEHFTITITNPVLINSTDVLIPPGSQVIGEVIEAVSSSHQEHRKGFPIPSGKLEVRLDQLKMLDGTIYPLAASLAGSATSTYGRYGTSTGQNNVMGGVGYVGSSSSFNATTSRNQRTNRYNRYNNNTTGNPFAYQPTYSGSRYANQPGATRSAVRSLVRRHHELYIDKGSPLTIRLDAPLKMSFGTTEIAPSATPVVKQKPPISTPDQSDSLF